MLGNRSGRSVNENSDENGGRLELCSPRNPFSSPFTDLPLLFPSISM